MSKNIPIAGASSGFGHGTAEALARTGHQIFASMRDIAGRNRLHTDALQARSIHVIELDVKDDIHAALYRCLSYDERTRRGFE